MSRQTTQSFCFLDWFRRWLIRLDRSSAFLIRRFSFPFHPLIQHRQQHQRQERRTEDAANDHRGERALHFRVRVNGRSCLESMPADARILRAFALAACREVELKAEILRLGLGGLLELDNHVVTVAFGQFGFAHEGVALLLKFQFCFAALGVRRDGQGLRGGGKLTRFLDGGFRTGC